MVLKWLYFELYSRKEASEIIKSNSLIKHFGGILINQIGSDIS